MCGMSESSAGHKETQPPRMKEDNNDLKTLKEMITAALDPFDDKINKDYLFNIKTGRKVDDDADKYLLNIFTEGTKRRDEFIAECTADPSRFEKSLKKTKIVNFVTNNMAQMNKTAAEVVDVRGTRDLFGTNE